jgi:hypothetical protein
MGWAVYVERTMRRGINCSFNGKAGKKEVIRVTLR